MKLKNIILITLTTIVLTSCYTANQISKFSSENIELGIDKNLFIKRAEFKLQMQRNSY